ncbi:MAG: hypothetical protein RXP28_02305 [Nitrososphaeria archaeon]
METKLFEIKGYGTVEVKSDGLLFRLQINGEYYTFLVSPERSINDWLKSIDKTLRTLQIGKNDRANILKAVAEIMPALSKFDIVKQKLYVPFWYDPRTNQVFEAIRINEKDVFLYYDGGFKITEWIDTESKRIMPIQYMDPYVFDALPDYSEPLKLSDIYNEVYEIFKDYYYHSDPRVHKFLSLYIIHSYLVSRSIGTAFVWLIGAKRSGKTTVQLIAEALGYRPVSGVGPSEAAIYRTLGYEVEYGPLIIIKEFERASELMKEISREGDIPGSVVPRTDKEGERMVVRNYHVYGSKIVASNRLHGDEADMDRYHVIKTEHGKPNKPRSDLYRNPNVIEKLNDLRNKLLLWKLVNFSTFTVPPQDDKITEGRDWEHYGGIITLAGMISPELQKEMYEYILEIINEKTEDEQNSTVVLTAKAILGLAELKKEILGIDNIKIIRIPFNEIWQKLSEDCTPIFDKNGDISRLQAPDGRILTYTSLGKLIQEQLFGKGDRWYENKVRIRGYSWTIDDLARLKNLVADGTGRTDGTGFSKSDAKNQDNLKINEIDSGDPQNTPKNDGLSPQKPVPSVLPVPTIPSNPNDPNQNNPDGIADMYKSEASPYPEERALSNFIIIVTKDDKKFYKCGNCQKIFADLDQAKAHACGGQGA